MSGVTSLFPEEPVEARPFEAGTAARKPIAAGASLFPEEPEAQRVRQAVESAASKSPDQAARVLKLQTKTGLPVDLIERNIDEIEREAARADFDPEKMRRESPILANWIAANPKHAELAKDDVANLSMLDKLLGSLKRGGYALSQQGSALAMGANTRMLQGFDELDRRIAAGEAPGAIPDALDPAGYRWMSSEQRSALRSSLGGAISGSVSNIVRREGQRQAIPVDPTIEAALGAKSFADFWFHFSEKPVEFIMTVGAESLPQMAPGLAGAVVAGPIGGLPAAAGAMGAGSFGVDYAAEVLGGLRDEGIDLRDRDAVAEAVSNKDLMARIGRRAFSHAAPVAAFDAASAGLAGLRLVPARKVAGVVAGKASVASALDSAARGGANLAAQGVVQGSMGAAGEAAGLVASDQEITAGALMAEFFGEFATAPVEVGGVAIATARQRAREKLRAAERTAFFEALGQGVSESKTFARMPEKLREFIAAATADGPVENVHVPIEAWSTFWQSQSVDPREAAAEVLGSTEFYEEAIRTGVDLAIPIADYATKIAPNAQANAAFAREIRLRPDELNARETEELDAAFEEAARQAPAAADSPVAGSAARVREDVIGQLTGAGFDRTAIDAYAGMYESAFRSLGERAGVDPFELYSRYGLRIGRPLPDVLRERAPVDSLDPLIDRVRAGRRVPEQEKFSPSITEFLRAQGGIQDYQGELAGRDVDKNLKPFQRRLMRPDGMAIDKALEAAREAGYFPPADPNEPDSLDITDLLEAIDADLRGERRYSINNANDEKLATDRMVASLADYLDTLGIDVGAMTNAEIKAALDRARELDAEGDIEGVEFSQDRRQIQVGGKWRPVENANGEPIIADHNPAKLAAFWRWFGDSKVVDKDGRPLVVYHGAPDARFMSEDATFKSVKRRLGMTEDETGAFWFAADRRTASTYADDRRAFDYQNAEPAVISAYLKLDNPLIVEGQGKHWRDAQKRGKTTDVIDEAREAGNDGVFVRQVRDNYSSIDKPTNGETTDTFVVFRSTQIKGVDNVGTFDPLSGNILHQPAYHGSPHDFDRFSTDKIGTGEGAQAFGWGLYFAENPAIATGYHRALAEDPEIQEFKVGRFAVIRGGQFLSYSPRDNTSLENVKATIIESLLVDENELRAAQASGTLKEFVFAKIAEYEDGYYDPEHDKELIAAVKQFRKSVELSGITFKLGKTTGGVYQVDIPDEVVARMLLWDKPLSEQPQAVRDAIASLGVLPNMSGQNLLDMDPDGETIYRALSRSLAKPIDEFAADEDGVVPRGWGVVQNTINDQLAADERASKALEALGIPGIKYLDGGSRNRALKDIKREFLAELPEDADFDEVLGLVGSGTFSPANERIITALAADDWLGFDYPAQALSAALGGRLRSDFGDASPELVQAVEDAQIEQPTHNLVVFNDKNVTLTHKDGSPVTPAERAEYFQQKPRTEGKRGRIAFGPERQFNIELFERADLSTFIHESGHFYLEVIGDLVEDISQRDSATWSAQQRQMVRDYGDLLEWLGVSSRAEIGVEQHEQWARGIEAYMREGRAPSPELRSILAKFRAWLVAVYRSLSQLRVELTPEVRDVMDRLFATDREIEAAQREAQIAPLFTDAQRAGMTEQEFAAYAETVQQAGERARDELHAKLMRQMQREREAWWRAEREAVLAEVAAEVYERREYVALAALTRGTLPDGSEYPDDAGKIKLDRRALVDAYGKEFLKRLPRPYIYAAEGGVHPDLAAQLFGYASGDELVLDMANVRPMKPLIEAETDARMRDRYGDMMVDGSISEAAKAAVNGVGREEIVAAELKALNKGLAASIIPSTEQINAMARGRIAQMVVRDIRPGAYLMAAQRASKEALGLVDTDRVGAMRAKQRELLNLALYREALRAQEQVEATVDYMRSFDKKTKRQRIGKAGADYLDQIDALLDRFEFKRVSLKVLERRKSLASWIAEKERAGLPVNLPDDLVEEQRRTNYRELTVEALAGLRDGVRHIEHLATLKNKLLKAARKRELDEVAADIETSVREHGKQREKKIETRLPTDNAARLVAGWFASHRKLASLVRQMDGFEDGGALWEYVVRPINAAADEEAAAKERATIELGKLFGQYAGRDAAALYRKQHIAEIGMPLTKMGRLMVALNWGNEANRQRVMDGYGWTESQVQAILNGLDERDWAFVEGVWKFIDSYWPAIEAKEKRVNGVAPEKVQAMPFTATVQTAAGPKTLNLAGGYFPIKYDDRQSMQASANLESEFADIVKQASHVRATTRRGHTKARAEKVEMPIRLDFGVIFEHVGQVVHDLSHHEMLLDVGRVIGHKSVQQAILDTHGDVVYRELKAALVDIAFGDAAAGTAWEKSIAHLRQGVSIAYMGWNLMTSLQQPLGLASSMVRVGPKWVAKGLSRMLRDATSLESTAAWIHDRSEFMRLRHKTQQREINEIRNEVGLTTGRLSGWVDEALRTTTFDHVTKQGVVDSYFWLIAKAQQIADVPTWIGAYEKAAADVANLNADGTLDEARVIALADQAVIDSQGGGQIKDLASIQRGGPMLKLWTNFYSFFNVTWNLTVESTRRTNYRDPVAIGRLAVDYLLLSIVPATLGALIKHALTGPDGEDGEELAAKLAKENLGYLFGLMVGLREIGSAALGFAGYEGPAGTRFFASIGKFVKQAGQGELDAAFWRSLNDTAGILLHYPAGQVRRTVEGFDAIVEGKTINPLALVLGAPKE
jgi:hypothetical protein